jgi:putative Holliday junction resolvase
MSASTRRTREGSESPAGRTLAFDFGDRRIGIAVSDPMGMAARPLMTLTRTTWPLDLERIHAIIREHEVRRIVVGMPLDMDGRRGVRARVTESFIERIKGATGLPVIAWDERLTTVQAQRILIAGDVRRERRRQVIDQVAAVILLQSYLDSQAVETGAAGEEE